MWLCPGDGTCPPLQSWKALLCLIPVLLSMKLLCNREPVEYSLFKLLWFIIVWYQHYFLSPLMLEKTHTALKQMKNSWVSSVTRTVFQPTWKLLSLEWFCCIIFQRCELQRLLQEISWSEQYWNIVLQIWPTKGAVQGVMCARSKLQHSKL